MLRRPSELPLQGDPSQRHLPWIIAVMVFLAALAVAGVLGLDGALDRWDQGLRGTLTVQVSPDGETEASVRVAAALEVLAATEGVARAEALSDADIAALLEPWLGAGNVSPELPVPSLIDVHLAPGVDVDLDLLAARLVAAAPGARLDDHSVWLDEMVRLARSVQVVAAVVVFVIVVAAIAIVVFTTRTGLAVHHDVIEVLHLVGARDSYIARQFQAQALLLGLRGGFLGLGLAAIILFLLSRTAGSLEGPFLPGFALGAGAWSTLVLLPLLAAAITTLTARTTVMRALAGMP
jgi:cell division transport system permease protein